MPFTIHEDAIKKQMTWDVSRPQEAVPETLREGWSGTPGGGLPVKQIPHMEFPLVVYKHPKKPFREVAHRNDRFEVVSTDLVPTEHLTKVICCDAHKKGGPQGCRDCNKLLEVALAQGWKREQYIPVPPPSADDDIYGRDEEAPVPAAPKKSTRGTSENPL